MEIVDRSFKLGEVTPDAGFDGFDLGLCCRRQFLAFADDRRVKFTRLRVAKNWCLA